MKLRQLLYGGAADVERALSPSTLASASVRRLCLCVYIYGVYVVYFEGTLKVKIDNSYGEGSIFCWACVQDTISCTLVSISRERASESTHIQAIAPIAQQKYIQTYVHTYTESKRAVFKCFMNDCCTYKGRSTTRAEVAASPLLSQRD